MKKKEIEAVIKKRFRKLNIISGKIVKDFRVEDIHLFRVESKKLRAFLRLLRTGLKSPEDLKFPKRLKKFYSVLGIIRLLQLQQEKIKKLVKEINEVLPSTYLDILRMESASHMIQAEDLIKRRSPFNREKKDIIDRIPRKLDESTIKKFTRLEVKKIGSLLKIKQAEDELLHTERKLLKDILYTWSFIGEDIIMKLPPVLSNNEDIRAASDQLGEFHDICTGLTLLEPHYIETIADEDERILLLNIKNEWEEERDNLRAQILNQFSKLAPSLAEKKSGLQPA